MPDPVLPGPQTKNPDPLGGLVKKTVRRWLGLEEFLEAAAFEIPALAPTVPPVINRALSGFSFQEPATFSNVYNDDLNIYNKMVGAPIQSIYRGVDWGLYDETEPVPGAVCTKEERTIDARGAFTVNKTYTVAETLYHPALVTQLENLMTGGTTGNETWCQWASQFNNVTTQAANYSWSFWAGGKATVHAGTITVQATALSTGTSVVDNGILQTNWGNWATAYHESKEQKEKRVAAGKEQERLYLEQKKIEDERKAKVKVRAEKILVRHLDATQALTLKEKGYFDVDIGEKVYRIWRGTHGNVKELSKDKSKEVASLCVQPNGVPTEDAMLAQLLWLRADEKALLRVANRTVLRT